MKYKNENLRKTIVCLNLISMMDKRYFDQIKEERVSQERNSLIARQGLKWLTGQYVIVQGWRGLNAWPFYRPAGAQIAPGLSKYMVVYLGYTGGKEGTGAIL